MSSLRARDLFVLLCLGLSLNGCGGETDDGGSSGSGSSGSTGGSSSGSGTGGSAGGGTATVSRACNIANDCILVSATCCGSCGAPAVDDMVAVAKGSEEAHRASVCGDGQAMCPACAAMRNPYLIATCEDGVCQARSLQQMPETECQTADQCFLRPATCCECGASSEYSDVVALSQSSSALTQFYCSPLTDCALCDWSPLNSYQATCDLGRCQVMPVLK